MSSCFLCRVSPSQLADVSTQLLTCLEQQSSTKVIFQISRTTELLVFALKAAALPALSGYFPREAFPSLKALVLGCVACTAFSAPPAQQSQVQALQSVLQAFLATVLAEMLPGDDDRGLPPELAPTLCSAAAGLPLELQLCYLEQELVLYQRLRPSSVSHCALVTLFKALIDVHSRLGSRLSASHYTIKLATEYRQCSPRCDHQEGAGSGELLDQALEMLLQAAGDHTPKCQVQQGVATVYLWKTLLLLGRSER